MENTKSVKQRRQERATELHKARHKKHPCTKLERFKGQFVKKGTKPGDKPRNHRVPVDHVEEKYDPPTTRKTEAEKAKLARAKKRLAAQRYRKYQANRKPQGKAKSTSNQN
ncbi:hypothetical protein CAEBREN_08811 [Caenorhabditis brenneri]|uniref:Uncharacterized protein n=1 Tax=Caenorhabditis brenneri TaxID=135651 RepID=G0N7U0_CAEBE|nr:hypothetical protein CAEBREN_08811 [Caenorhabditis brenneri]